MLSPQSVVSCSAYSQGCDGGFAYLVAKYAEDWGVATDPCFPYEAGIVGDAQPACAKQCADASQAWRATNYRYVGGYFGNCSEVAMMRELVSSGPLAVGITVPASFEAYTGGVYVETRTMRRATSRSSRPATRCSSSATARRTARSTGA